MSLKLTDLIDLGVLKELIQSTWCCSGLPTKIIDPQGRVLISSGDQDICFLFHRRHPVTLKGCIENDTERAAALRTRAAEGTLLETRCHSGLNHIGLPIVVAGQHLATLFLSQFFYDPPDEKIYRQRARDFGFDEEEYLAALRKVPVLNRARVKEGVAYCEVLVRLLTEMGTREAKLLESQERLQRSEKKFRSLFQSANDALFIIDPSGHILDVNDIACARLGYSRAELRQMHVRDIDSTMAADAGETQVRRILNEEVLVFETVHESRDGREIPVEISARKLEIESSAVILSSARDLTERKQVEAALRESEERFRNVIESIPLGVHLYQLKGDELVLTGANPAADTILKIEHAPFLGRTIEETFLIPADTKLPERYREVCRGGRWESLEVPYHDDIIGVFEFHAFHTGTNRMAVLFSDISERKKREEELLYRESFEALIAGISTRFMEVGPAGLDRTIEATLFQLIAFAGVDRAYIFCLSEDGTRMSNTHEACSAGTPCEQERLQNVSVTDFPWIMAKLRAREVVHIPRLADLPPEAAREQKHFSEHGIQSMLSVPVLIKGNLSGVVGFDAVHAEKVWDERDIVLLHTFGDLLGSALERRRATEAIEYRSGLELLIATLSTRMVNLDAETIDTAIDAALADIGTFVGVDRCYVFQFSADGCQLSNTHEWCAPGILSYKEDLQDAPTSNFPWFLEQIARREPVLIPAVADLGPEAQSEKREFERQRIRSLLCVPMLIEERVIGFIGFDSVRQRKKWPSDLILLLRLVGESVANALERRRKEWELRENRDRIAAILRSLRGGLVGVDKEGRIILLNRPATDILGVEAAGSHGRLLSERPIEPALQKQIASVLAGQIPQPVEWTFSPREGGSARTIQARTGPIRSDDGRLSGAIALLRDVSAEREVDRIKSEFISTAAHELRTPLSSVLGYAELLLDKETFGNFSPEEEREFLEEIYKKAEVLTDLINDLLDLSRIESGQLVHLTLSSAPLDLLIEEVVEDFRRRIPERRFEQSLPETLPDVTMDAAKIRQVLENLLGNAVKFSSSGSRIRVEAVVQPDRIEVEVTDEGTGMSPEVVAHIFDKFYRGSADHSVAGLGLGMSIVKNIIEAHGGDVRVESTQGEGTRVTFSLPLSET